MSAETLLAHLRLAGGVSESDRPLVDETLAQAANRLANADRTVDWELSIKDRESPGMVTTLEAWVHGLPRLVATSTEGDLRDALNDVGHDLVKQYNTMRDKLSPKQNRQRRDTIRG